MAEKPRKPPLAIVGQPAATSSPLASTSIAPPRKLGQPGLDLWNAVQSEFRVEDVGGVELLMQACLAADRAEALAARIDADGETIATKIGIKAHPALRDELAARSFIVRTLQRLGVTEQPLKSVGRPPGRVWRD
jgi:hypothetical protein